MFEKLFQNLTDVPKILISLSIILFAGFLVTRLTKKLKLPNVSGYIIAGILIGPFVLNLIPKTIISNMSFLNDIALSFIAFNVGKFFKKDVLRKTGKKVIVITIAEALLAGIIVTLSLYLIFHMDFSFCLLLGAIATATAPASTMMTIDQYHAEGEFVNTLLQVVALDDVVCLVVFSIATSIVKATSVDLISFWDIALPLIYNIVALGLGFLCGLILSKVVNSPNRSQDNRLIIAVAMLLGVSGLCACFNVSPLLACMIMGATYINFTKDKSLYHQLSNFSAPILSGFFVLSGMSLNIGAITTMGLVGLCYFVVRIIGKYAGATLGCLTVKASKPLTKYLGMALIPQAGVAIGLAFLGQRILGGEKGDLLLTIILSSSLLYELVGPVMGKLALTLSGAIKPTIKTSDTKTTNTQQPSADSESIDTSHNDNSITKGTDTSLTSVKVATLSIDNSATLVIKQCDNDIKQ